MPESPREGRTAGWAQFYAVTLGAAGGVFKETVQGQISHSGHVHQTQEQGKVKKRQVMEQFIC